MERLHHHETRQEKKENERPAKFDSFCELMATEKHRKINRPTWDPGCMERTLKL